MAHLVAVTGASGNIGRVLVERLLRVQVSVRVIGRSRDKLAPFVARGAEERVGDLQDSSFLNEALRGVDAMFAMIPEHPDHPDFLGDKRRTVASLAGALRAASVPRVVALSAIGGIVGVDSGPLARGSSTRLPDGKPSRIHSINEGRGDERRCDSFRSPVCHYLYEGHALSSGGLTARGEDPV